MFDVVLVILGAVGILVFGIWLPARIRTRSAAASSAGELAAEPVRPRPRLVRPEEARGAPPVLPPALFRVALGVGVVLFLILLGPVWAERRDVDHAALLSYLPIPIVVGVGLRVLRQFEIKTFLLGTLIVCVWKFMITASMVVAVWMIWGPSKPSYQTSQARLTPVEKSARRPAPEIRGVVRGRVLDETGQPAKTALVFVAGGALKYAFAAPTQPVVLFNDGQKISPPVVVAQVGQGLRLVAADGRLHTAEAHKKDKHGFNFPVVGETERALPPNPGRYEVRCAVHPEESPALLFLLEHPFWTWTDAEGRFELTELPNEALEFVAWRPGEEARRSIRLDGSAELDFDLLRPAGPE